MTVSVILKMLAGGKTVDDVLEAYPDLQPEDIYQAMQYAAGAAATVEESIIRIRYLPIR